VAEIDKSTGDGIALFEAWSRMSSRDDNLVTGAAGTYAAMRKLFEDFHGEPLPAALRQQLGALVLCFVTVSFVIAEPCVR
jgi:hypothetical protein